jgi:hypothetical protein
MEVSWTAFAPSASASQISISPERFDAKATRRPSGENVGFVSLRVDAIKVTGAETDGAPGPEVSTRQRFSS